MDAVERSLHAWQTPEVMFARAEELSELLGDFAMLRQGRLFREAHVASRFARRRGAGLVRLLREAPPDPTPDFAVMVDGRELVFETTEADVPGRRRGDEYKGKHGVQPIWFVHMDQLIGEIAKQVSKKAAKRYTRCNGLVVWVNAPALMFRPDDRWDGLIAATAPASEAFDEVWAMRGSGALLWKAGVAQVITLGSDF